MSFFDIFLCHKATEVDDEAGGPESTAGAMYTSEQGMKRLSWLKRNMWLGFLFSRSSSG